jgi:hypothetical protein
MIVRSRHLATTLALALTAGGITVAVAGPAQAMPIGCSYYHSKTVTSTYIEITYYEHCNTGNTELPTSIEQGNSVVASGLGEAIYYCSGSTETEFYTDYYGNFDAACG